MNSHVESIPILSAAHPLSSTSYPLSSDDPPLLNLTLTSHHTSTITIYCDELSPALLVRYCAFEITNLATGFIIPQVKRTRCVFEPPSKVEVNLDKELFYELRPEEPVTISTPFDLARRSKQNIAQDSNNAAKTCRSRVDDVNILQPNHSYLIQLSDECRLNWWTIRWWEYGYKEEVLHFNTDGVGLDARKVKFKPGPHGPIRLDVSGFRPFVLTCPD